MLNRLLSGVRKWRWTWIGVAVAIIMPILYLRGDSPKDALLAFILGLSLALSLHTVFDEDFKRS